MKRIRFAPSPTGLLHLGNAYSALMCEAWAKQHQAQLLLRIEDIDFTRCRSHFSQQLQEDLAWLGVKFDGQVVYQMQRYTYYEQALQQLKDMDVLYPCFCTRSEIEAAPRASDIISRFDAYPQICRDLTSKQREVRLQQAHAWRLDMQKAIQLLGTSLHWLNQHGEQRCFELENVGDVIVGRKDIHYSYHLCVVVDDALQGITHVIRGMDLLSSTPVHRVLQGLLHLPHPVYFHHPMIVDEQGQRLAKAKASQSLQSLRKLGMHPDTLRQALLA